MTPAAASSFARGLRRTGFTTPPARPFSTGSFFLSPSLGKVRLWQGASKKATTSTLPASSFDVPLEPVLRTHQGPAKQEVFSRSTSFEHSVSRASRNPTPLRSTKTKFGAPMMRNRFLHLFRRAFMIGLSNPRFGSRLASLSRLSYIVVAFAVAFIGL